MVLWHGPSVCVGPVTVYVILFLQLMAPNDSLARLIRRHVIVFDLSNSALFAAVQYTHGVSLWDLCTLLLELRSIEL